MDSSTNGLIAQADVPGAATGPVSPWIEFMAQFDGFFFLFCTFGLMYVILSQYVRHRRRQKNLDRMRAYWKEQRLPRSSDIGSDSTLRYETGIVNGGE